MVCGIESNGKTAMVSQFAGNRQRCSVLVCEDHEDVLAAISLLLKSNGYDGVFVQTPSEAIAALRRRAFDAILLDLNYSRDTTSGGEGMDLLAQVQAIDATLPVVVMTAWGTIELAVEAMHRGANDFVQKPWDNARLLEVLEQQTERGRKLRANKKHEEHELQEAAQIQRALLPSNLAAPRGLAITASTRSLGNVSGDYYDVIRLDEHRSAICIADVMGKGVGAALLMSHLQASVRMLAPQVTEPSEMCSRLNQMIALNGVPGKFITLFYCVVDTDLMRITYTNAGHNWPILVHKDGSYQALGTDDAVLGMFAPCEFRQQEAALSSGDRLLLFTDGVTECTNLGGEEFGEAALRTMACENVHLNAQQLEQAILQSVRAHCDGLMSDDATLMVAAVA